jgi:hypothetical protein
MKAPRRSLAAAALAAALTLSFGGNVSYTNTATAQTAPPALGDPPITVSRTVPNELNPPFLANTVSGAPGASPAQASAFAWQEFIALNWPAGVQQGKPNERDAASLKCHFGDPECNGPTVWETYRGKVEIFPGTGVPPGYPGPSGDKSFGYDALPQYNYEATVPACDPDQANDAVPWVNLDETSQINLDYMYAGASADANSPGNSAPSLIRFLAKGNRAEYEYVAKNSSPSDQTAQWWYTVPADVVSATKAYLAQNLASPPAGSSTMISLPYGTIETKAGWRPLTSDEKASGHFHMQTVRFYEAGKSSSACYRDATWGLVSLHIIQKTPSAPYFIYATFEQSDNLLTQNGRPIETVNGRLTAALGATPTSPQECLVDPQPPVGGPANPAVSKEASIIQTSDPATCEPLPVDTYCDDPGDRLYYRDFPSAQSVPSGGNICVNRRINSIPSYVIDANRTAHQAIATYLRSKNISSAPWQFYKLVNVQYYPYDKDITNPTPNGSPFNSTQPYTAENPERGSYYLSNIVVETNRSLQLFSGGLSAQPTAAVASDWNADGTPKKNVAYNGHFSNMGGCMGCHGAAGQNRPGAAGDFSVILAVGHVPTPDIPPPPPPP